MEINADFTQRVAIKTASLDWTSSPSPGVDRRMLDRIGDEVARATSIVRYAADSRFPEHVHGGGEEFIVLEGVFQDEHGDYPAGWYIRNPPTSAHTPRSDLGCTIFVKLWQFDPADRLQIKRDMSKLELVPDPERPGVAGAELFSDDREVVRVEQWAAGTTVHLGVEHGAELLVLEGSITEGETHLDRHDWLRLPPGSTLSAHAGVGAKLWIKIHRSDERVPSFPSR
jgi:hypothetical protein